MLQKLDNYRWLVPKSEKPGMKLDGIIYADDELIKAIQRDKTLEQVMNVATMPGLVGWSLAMPDAHQGYGFPIGGVAAANLQTGVVSPGGIGYDINCGVRLLTTPFELNDVLPKLEQLVHQLFRDIPSGAGKGGRVSLQKEELDKVLVDGARWAVRNSYGKEADLEHIEENGCIPNADASCVSDKAKKRGHDQLGTLGSGNHFLEVQRVDKVFDENVAKTLHLHEGQVVVLMHTGSRGLGHQTCTDFLEVMEQAMPKYGISVVDRELACIPISSPEGQKYLKAMAAAANFAFTNRQMITHWTRDAFQRILGSSDLNIVYDVCHNIAKQEEHQVDGTRMKVLVHRKGATRAFPPHHPQIPKDYQEIGQPVLIPGSMGTCSYVLVGTEGAMRETFGSTCHGAGRAKSRHAALRESRADEVIQQLKDRSVIIKCASKAGIVEEKPDAYKDVSAVVEVVHQAGIAKKVAKLVPMGVIKG
jgi:tRNA-splicing ligase RtcB